jgi:DNA-binding response OmpR family regulator
VIDAAARTILVVDDDPDILGAIQLTLEFAGYAVIPSMKGEYAQNLHDGNGGLPDLIILDILLSGTDGRLICKQLKSRDDTKQIPIIIISAHPDARASAMEAGADDFLAKPFDIDDLIALTGKYISGA